MSRLAVLLLGPLVVMAVVVALPTLTASGWPVTLSVLAGIAYIASVILRNQAAIHPLRVFAWLAVGSGCVAGVVWLVSQLRLSVFLGTTAALAFITVAMNLWQGRGKRQARSEAGQCADCGYDLRSSAEMCPECGATLPEELSRRRRIAAGLRAARDGSSVAASLDMDPPLEPKSTVVPRSSEGVGA